MSHLTTSTRIINLLKRSPKSGVPNWRLAGITLRYGARIKDLRDSGHRILTQPRTRGTYIYLLQQPS